MTIMSSFWVIMSYRVDEVSFWWCSAIMEINMLNALERYLQKPVKRERLTERSPQHWEYLDPDNERGFPVMFEVYQQDERPPVVDESRTTFYDWREKDLYWESKKSVAKSDKKVLPATINFGKPKQVELAL